MNQITKAVSPMILLGDDAVITTRLDALTDAGMDAGESAA